MKYTDNHNLNLPETTDNVDIEKLNENFIAIDDKLGTHPDITTTGIPTTSQKILSFGDTFAAVKNITRDNNGHTTKFEIVTCKLPEEPEHPAVETNNPTVSTTPTTLENGSIFAAVVNITRDANGHTTSFEVRMFKITSSCVKNGTITHDSANMTIDTGFTETPKIFKLYYTTDGSTVELAVECRPELDAPFNFINHSGLPINSVDFNGGVATVNCSVSTGLTFMWEAYI